MMENNVFYKLLAALSTVGIIAIAGLLVPIANQESNNLEKSVAQTKRELRQAQKDALAEVQAMRKKALAEVKTARAESLKALKKASTKESTVWLVLSEKDNLEAIEMKSLDQCELQGAIFKASKRIQYYWEKGDALGFECLEGK